ncbi:MAG: FAD-dependent oxidoreductase [Candidatus Marinimicrobia bacterium]|nr:FAD-dependent oxidoreductase [Candidatus Neomarinimicrobiota bacterium]
MKIAIIGTGISGLTAAYLLNRKHEITVFEKNDYIGGHTHTHTIKTKKSTLAVDSGFIVYNEVTYPNFIKLLDQLGVQRQKTTMGFSVKSVKKNLEYAGNSLNSLFAQRLNYLRYSFWIMLRDILRFNKKGKADLPDLSAEIKLGDYLKQNNYSLSFINHYIIPMGSAIWSTNAQSMLDMPALFFIRFFNNHGLMEVKNRSGWWVIKGGSKEYVKKMIAEFDSRIKLNTAVQSISRTDNKITIQVTDKKEIFDVVVIATHSDQALRMLADSTNQEKEILGALPYQSNEAILHTDSSVLPKRKLAWASWNYNLDQEPYKPMAMTYNMNILQTLDSEDTYCVTLNNNDLVDDEKIVKTMFYDHPQFTPEGIKAQKRKHEISGVNNTYYCGAYWRNGFHEDGVVSALEVCSHFGVNL